MSEFNLREWEANQRLQQQAARQFQKKMTALAKKAARGGKSGGGYSRTLNTYKRTPVARATRGQGSWTSTNRTPPLVLKIHAGGQAGDRYAERQEGSTLIDSNMLGQTAFERQAEFHLDTLKHPRVDPKNLFQHVSLSRPAGQDLTEQQWVKVVRQFLKQIGADGVQYVITRHSNTSNDHCHLIFSRSLPSGKLLSLSNQRWTWRAALRQVEADLGITAIERPRPTDTPASDRMVNAQRRAARLGASDPFISRAAIADALAQSTSHEQFARRLEAVGIEVQHSEKNGKVTGLIFRKTGASEFLAGSSIDRNKFTLQRVQAQTEMNRLALLKQEQQMHDQSQRQAEQKREREQALQPNYQRDI